MTIKHTARTHIDRGARKNGNEYHAFRTLNVAYAVKPCEQKLCTQTHTPRDKHMERMVHSTAKEIERK